MQETFEVTEGVINKNVDRRKIDNTLANRKRAKGQTTMYIILQTAVRKMKKLFCSL
jgi:hypothetical protein